VKVREDVASRPRRIWGGFAGLLHLNAAGILATVKHQQNGEEEPKKVHLSLNHLVGVKQDGGRNVETDRLGGLERDRSPWRS